MKKYLVAFYMIIVLSFGVFALSACNNQNEEKPSKINIVMPDGAPSLAMAKLMKEKPQVDGINTTYEIVNGASEISAKFANKEADAAIIPTNLAATLYNKGADIVLVSVNVKGLLYMVGTQPANSLNDLVGEVVYNIGRGATPDLTFKYILSKNKIEYVESQTPVEGKVALHYVSSGSELIPLLKNKTAKFGILGEPAVTQSTVAAQTQVLFDIQQLWNTATNTTDGIPQASLVIKRSLAEKYPNIVSELLTLVSQNNDWIKTNSSELSEILKNNGSALSINFSQAIVNRCNISATTAVDAKVFIDAYLKVLYEMNPKTIGEKMPDNNFYYGA